MFSPFFILLLSAKAGLLESTCDHDLKLHLDNFLLERISWVTGSLSPHTHDLGNMAVHFSFAILPAWLENAVRAVCQGKNAVQLPEFGAVADFLESTNEATNHLGTDGVSLAPNSLGKIRNQTIADPANLFKRVDQWTAVVSRLVTKVNQFRNIETGRKILRQDHGWEDWISHKEGDQLSMSEKQRNVQTPISDRYCTVVLVNEYTTEETMERIVRELSHLNPLVIEDSPMLLDQLKVRPKHLGKLAERNFRVCWRRHIGTLTSASSISRCSANLGLQVSRQIDARLPVNGMVGYTTGRESASSLDALLAEYIRRHHAFVRAKEKTSEKVLVYVCNPRHPCGGTGDRINGIISVFLLAVISDRMLFIDSDAPYDLSVLLKPNRIDWRLAKPTYGLVSDFQTYIDDQTHFNKNVEQIVTSASAVIAITFNHRQTEALLQLAITNVWASKTRHLANGLHTVPFLAAEIYNFLFTPTAYLQRELEKAQKLIFGPESNGEEIYVGIHFRAGDGSKESWVDPARHSLSADLPKFLECAEIAEKSLGLGDKEVPWLLSADVSEDRIRAGLATRPDWLRKLRFPEDVGVMHVDRSFDLGQQLIGPVKVQVAHMLLSKAAAAVMSRSYFGETAMEIGKVDHVFFYDGCVLTDLSSS